MKGLALAFLGGAVAGALLQRPRLPYPLWQYVLVPKGLAEHLHETTDQDWSCYLSGQRGPLLALRYCQRHNLKISHCLESLNYPDWTVRGGNVVPNEFDGGMPWSSPNPSLQEILSHAANGASSIGRWSSSQGATGVKWFDPYVDPGALSLPPAQMLPPGSSFRPAHTARGAAAGDPTGYELDPAVAHAYAHEVPNRVWTWPEASVQPATPLPSSLWNLKEAHLVALPGKLGVSVFPPLAFRDQEHRDLWLATNFTWRYSHAYARAGAAAAVEFARPAMFPMVEAWNTPCWSHPKQTGLDPWENPYDDTAREMLKGPPPAPGVHRWIATPQLGYHLNDVQHAGQYWLLCCDLAVLGAPGVALVPPLPTRQENTGGLFEGIGNFLKTYSAPILQGAGSVKGATLGIAASAITAGLALYKSLNNTVKAGALAWDPSWEPVPVHLSQLGLAIPTTKEVIAPSLQELFAPVAAQGLTAYKNSWANLSASLGKIGALK